MRFCIAVRWHLRVTASTFHFRQQSTSAGLRGNFVAVNVPMYYRDAGLFGPRKSAGLGGIRVPVDDALKIGTRLVIELFFAGGGSRNYDVRVVWLRPSSSDFAKYEVALEFLGAMTTWDDECCRSTTSA